MRRNVSVLGRMAAAIPLGVAACLAIAGCPDPVVTRSTNGFPVGEPGGGSGTFPGGSTVKGASPAASRAPSPGPGSPATTGMLDAVVDGPIAPSPIATVGAGTGS